jgi:hypothetical protein
MERLLWSQSEEWLTDCRNRRQEGYRYVPGRNDCGHIGVDL